MHRDLHVHVGSETIVSIASLLVPYINMYGTILHICPDINTSILL